MLTIKEFKKNLNTWSQRIYTSKEVTKYYNEYLSMYYFKEDK